MYSIFIINLTINRRNKMKKTVKNLTVGLLVVLLANVGILVVDQDVAMAASCNLTTTNNMFGSSTSGYCGNDSVSLSTTSNMFGSSTSGYVGSNRYSTSTTNNMFGSSTNGYSSNSRINLNSSSNMFGSSTSGYVGNPRTSINSINTGLSCFWNC